MLFKTLNMSIVFMLPKITDHVIICDFGREKKMKYRSAGLTALKVDVATTVCIQKALTKKS